MEKNYELLTVDEARSILRVGRNVMYDLINNGGVPHVKIGKQNRIPRAELELWIEQQIITS